MNRFKQEYQSIREREKANREAYDRDDGFAQPPHTICLSVNNNCFMRCCMCDIGVFNRDKSGIKNRLFSDRYGVDPDYRDVRLDDLKHLVDQTAHFNPVIKTNFVEPLLYKPLPQLAEHVKSRGLKFYTITNGWLLKKHADWLTELPCDLIRISLDGPETVHDDLRGIKGSYQRVMDGIDKLLSLKKGGQKDRPLIGLCYTISDHNYDCLKEFMDAVHGAGFLKSLYINFNHLFYTTDWEVEQSRAQSPLFEDLNPCSTFLVAPEKVDAKVLADQIEKLHRAYDPGQYHYYFSPRLTTDDLEPYYDPARVMHPGAPCRLPWYAAQVSVDGELGVYGHCILPSLGNVFKDGFDAAWNSTRAKHIRKELKATGSFAGCNKCIGSLGPLRGRD